MKIVSSRLLPRLVQLALCAVLFWTNALWAAPFSKTISFTQPDGLQIELWGEGDEFYAVFETLDGYTVVFDPATKAYYYAELSADQTRLLSTGVQVGQSDPALLGLPKHLRITPDARKQLARENRQRWDQTLGISHDWQNLKALRRAQEQNTPPPAGIQPVAPLGTVVALCLLIDFEDDVATIPATAINQFCNGDSFTNFYNNGSVKKYFEDNSNRCFAYSNVVTAYIRIPNSLHPKSYYDDPTKDCGLQGRALITDAIAVMKTLPNYYTEIWPTFRALTLDGGGLVVALNVFYAGYNSGVWAGGLWPHSWALASPVSLDPYGMWRVWRYQITDMGDAPQIGTFCHESGHLVCHFPDIYDYDYDSVGGAGLFCLMNYGNFTGYNPSQICGYLKYIAGWSTVTELSANSLTLASVTAAPADNFNHFYRYPKPGVPTEYFLIENRQRTHRDAALPGSGIAIWHIDELGDRDNQSLIPNTTHANYEVTLVAADNQWHFQNYINYGDANDLFYRGNTAPAYSHRFSDFSTPNAHWWDGTASGMDLRFFGPNEMTMSFAVETTNTPAPYLYPLPSANAAPDLTLCWSPVGLSEPNLNTIGTILSPAISVSAPTPPSDNAGSPNALGNALAPENQPQAASMRAPSTAALATPWFGEEPSLPESSDPASIGEMFEGDFPGSNWTLSGDPTWAASSYAAASGTRGGWCAGSSLRPGTGYTNNMYAWMSRGPFNLQNAVDAKLLFNYLTDSEQDHDFLFWGVSTNGFDYFGQKVSGFNPWTAHTFDLCNVQTLGNLCGQPRVWLAFLFISDSSVCGPGPGAFLDNIQLHTESSLPELQAAQFQFPTYPVVEQDPFWLDVVVTNTGTLAAAASHVKLYLSSDGDSITTDDVYLGEQPVGPLAPGASETVRWNFSMPDCGFLNYAVWAVAVVDSQYEVLETSESNLFRSASTFSVSDRLTLYFAECDTNASFSTPVNSGWVQQTCALFRNLKPGNTYWYRVKAKRNNYESAWSAPRSCEQLPPPLLSVSPASLDFGFVAVGATAERTFLITNIGAGVASGTVTVSPPFFVLPPSSYSLCVDQGQAITIRYAPPLPGAHSALVHFTGEGGSTNSVSAVAVLQPNLTSPSFSVNGEFQFGLLGEAGRPYEIQFSTNLTAWVYLAYITNATGSNQFVDALSTNAPRRFYRTLVR